MHSLKPPRGCMMMIMCSVIYKIDTAELHLQSSHTKQLIHTSYICFCDVHLEMKKFFIHQKLRVS